MKTKQITLALVVMGSSSCLAYIGQIDAQLMQVNSQWNVVPGSFSNAPLWLVPTNVPVQLHPLIDGQWIWTTNMAAGWIGGNGTGIIDHDKERQLRQQERQRLDETDPPGIAHVVEYTSRKWSEWSQRRIWNTNMAENWWGVWTEDTNTGWRVNLRIFPTNAPNVEMTVHVGSIVTNSGAGLMSTPDGKYAKLELLDASGKAVPTRRGAAAKLYAGKNAVMASAETEHVNNHPPSADDVSVKNNYPDTISDLEYSRWKKGSFLNHSGFAINGPPCHIGYIKFNDIFSIKSEGDYTLTVQPVLYRMHNDGGTFQGYLDRVDLPSVTTKVHLVPNEKR
jgi:hypothetical protein